MKQLHFDIAIIGGGPAGILFNQLVINSFPDKQTVIFEKEKELCNTFLERGVYSRNYYQEHTNTPWDCLVDNKLTGLDIKDYLTINHPKSVIHTEVDEIKKQNNGLFEIKAGDTIYSSNQIVLATGLKLKKVPKLKMHLDFDITNKRGSDLKKINYQKHEIIFVGSGDNVLFKAAKLGEYLLQNHLSPKHVPIKIFIKKNFSKKTNPVFLKQVEALVDARLVQIIDDCWDIVDIHVGRNGLINTIHTVKKTYPVVAPGGAYIGVYVGYEIVIPKLTDCGLDDFIVIGDAHLFLRKKDCNLIDTLVITQKAFNDQFYDNK